MNKRIIIAVLLATAAFAYILWPRGIDIVTTNAQYGDMSVEYPLSGIVRHESAIPVAAPADGIISYAANLGQAVKKGDLLMSVETKKDSKSESKAVLKEKGEAVPVIGSTAQTFEQAQSVPVMPASPTPAPDPGKHQVEANPLNEEELTSPVYKQGFMDFFTDILAKAQGNGIELKEYNDSIESSKTAAIGENSGVLQDEGVPASLSSDQSFKDAIDSSESTHFKETSSPEISPSPTPKLTNKSEKTDSKASNVAKNLSEVEGTVISTLPTGGSVEKGSSAIIIGMGPQSIHAEVSQDQIASLHSGMPATFTYEGREWRGQISDVKNEGVEIQVPEGFSAPEGSKVDIRIVEKHMSDVVFLPVNAIGKDGNESYVMVVGDRKLSKRVVKTGINSRGNTAIEEGLGVGEQVALDPEKYRDGQRVKIKG